jgi:CRP/FNR family transcriptional regulator
LGIFTSLEVVSVLEIHSGDQSLAAVPLFSQLSSEALEELARSTRVRSYPRGHILCHEGDPGDSLIVLESGQLRVSRYSAAGDEAVLAVVEPPAVVGELALLDGAPRDATVIAQRAVTVRLVPRSVFLDLVKKEPAAVDGLLRALADLVRTSNARHADFVSLDVPGRVAKWLLLQAAKGGEPVPTVCLGRSQGELAAELGTTRSTLNRALREFESRGLVEVGENQVTILKPDVLRGYTT